MKFFYIHNTACAYCKLLRPLNSSGYCQQCVEFFSGIGAKCVKEKEDKSL